MMDQQIITVYSPPDTELLRELIDPPPDAHHKKAHKVALASLDAEAIGSLATAQEEQVQKERKIKRKNRTRKRKRKKRRRGEKGKRRKNSRGDKRNPDENFVSRK